METWLAPKKAAQYIKEHNPGTMIGERTLRILIKNGFPSLHIDSRTLINVSTFESDLAEYIKTNRLKYYPENTILKSVLASGGRSIDVFFIALYSARETVARGDLRGDN